MTVGELKEVLKNVNDDLNIILLDSDNEENTIINVFEINNSIIEGCKGLYIKFSY